MTTAFEPGDPVLELAALGKGIPNTVLEEDDKPWIRKTEQLKIDEVCTAGRNIFLHQDNNPSPCSHGSCDGSERVILIPDYHVDY